MQRLAQQEVEKYRQKIRELDAKARKPGNSLDHIIRIDAELLSPHSPIGKQIYRSYSDEELLDIFLQGQEAPDHKLGYHNIYIVYRRYINERFKDEWTAKVKARTLVKQRKEKLKWPPDWPDRVSVEPLLAELKRRNKELTPGDMQMLIRFCEISRQTGFPPELKPFERQRLDKLFQCRRALELMGIPYMNKATLKHMKKYWASERQKSADGGRQEKPAVYTIGHSEP